MEAIVTSQEQTLGQSDVQDRARAYKSRNKRPCDFCRYKKAACHLESKPPCELCLRYGKDCTFVESPAKRRRPNLSEERSQEPFDSPMFAPLMFEQFDPVQAGLAPPLTQSSHSPESAQSIPTSFFDNAQEPSLDVQGPSNSQLIGLSGEYDPYLLRRYRYDGNNECISRTRRIRRVGENDKIPVHFLIQQNKTTARAEPAESLDHLESLRLELDQMISNDHGRRLIKLFFRFVQPYFPVLSRERSLDNGDYSPGTMPTWLLAAVYGHALPYCTFDDQLCLEVYTPPSADSLFRIAWSAVQPNYHTPSLSVVQTLLLLVQRRPTNKHVADTPFKWTMMTDAVSIAQSLGLNLDPSDWPLPLWEQRLRRRLSWAVFVQEKWIALNTGRSSHLMSDDWDVNPLTQDDFELADGSDDRVYSEHFIQLAALTEIVDDILRSLFSIKAARKLCTSLDMTLEVARPLRVRLSQWYQELPPNLLPTVKASYGQGLNAQGGLHLAYITAKIQLFRAMLRPESEPDNYATTALRTGAISMGKDLFEFVESLDTNHMEAYWPSYSRTNFMIASNFMLLLFVTSPNSTDAKECLDLLNSWRSLLRIKSRSGDLLNLALLRLDALFVSGLDKTIDLSPSALQVFGEQQIK
ncbi:fungal-specific transcription factor domain-containing protein [Aureobasidium namibiae CBS 147.97]|uniref:Fungal-specific transcription factor domain-containing protein n=1 Tax=Aureobasidium namibiae CBS 147.97 TaxID=1043004 RepID=A0A074WLT5_9PEZI|nr:fungal-specific transcription factor domain-containing protein [Aureobasidium namibiae CBS 147.97]KEQ72559.1 fungal-specific transcription factor domain-containing protein [Aureobasidium namibiae CBS 147.97]